MSFESNNHILKSLENLVHTSILVAQLLFNSQHRVEIRVVPASVVLKKATVGAIPDADEE